MAQTVEDDRSALLMYDALEQLAEEDAMVDDWEDELSELAYLLESPLNLNLATRDELERFPFLTDAQIEHLLAYLYTNQGMATVGELQLVEQMDKRTIELLLPYVCVKPVKERIRFPTFRQLMKYGRHEAVARVDIPFYQRKGYETVYLGPSNYHSLRYQFRYGDYVQAGVTAEKDAGEPMFALYNRRGYDYYSPYLLLRGKGRLKTLALGNYKLNYGQGLVLSSAFRPGKLYTLTDNYRSHAISKHSSTDEFGYFSGLAAEVSLTRHLDMSAFYAYRKLGGTLQDDGSVSSIYKTGLHRSQKEADKRDLFSLQTAGGNVAYRGSWFKIGATGVYYRFSKPYEPRLTGYAKYRLHGSRFYNAGVDYTIFGRNLSWQGEAAKGTKGFALFNQVDWEVADGYKARLIHRFYRHDYWAFFARAFGENSAVQNENGWYAAIEVTPFRYWKFFFSTDFFASQWWNYRVSKPSKGMDVMARATYRPQGEWGFYLQYRFKRKERDITGTGGEVTTPTVQHKARLRFDYTPGSWQLRTTADYTLFGQQGRSGVASSEEHQGFLVSQQAAYAFHFPLTFTVQAAYFHALDYDARVYSSERGLLYTFYTPSFYGRGFRASAVVRYDFGRRLMLLGKLGGTFYQNRNTIGSGNDLIEGNRKCDCQLQLRVKF